jgi:stage II sporulation protein M
MKKKVKKFSLKNEYKKCFDYLKDSKRFIFSIVAIFLIFTLLGFFLPASDSLAQQILKFIEELVLKTEGMSQGELIKFILLNNVQSSFFGMIFGVFLGIFSIIATISNGYLLGFVASMIVKSEGFLILWRLLPHGIFELPAIFISLGLGVKFGTFIFQKNKIKSFKEYFSNSLRVFLLIIIPLLIVAAIIEGSLMALVN